MNVSQILAMVREGANEYELAEAMDMLYEQGYEDGRYDGEDIGYREGYLKGVEAGHRIAIETMEENGNITA